MTTIKCLPSSILIHEILSHHILLDDNYKDQYEKCEREVLSLRLVCKQWNDDLVNSADFWRQFLISNLKKGIKIRNIDDFNEKIQISSFSNNSDLMRYSIYTAVLVEKTIKACTHREIDVDGSYVVDPASPNISNNELVSKMIDQLTPFIFITFSDIPTSVQQHTHTMVRIVIGNITGKPKITRLYFTVVRCDYEGGNGGVIRESKAACIEGYDELLRVVVFVDGTVGCQSCRGNIRYVMEEIGLCEEMINSEECVKEFLLAVYYQSVVRRFAVTKFERELFEITD